jgi:hypothetical protein
MTNEYNRQLTAYQLIQSIANEYIELSHDKVLWQRNEIIKTCKDWLKHNQPSTKWSDIVEASNNYTDLLYSDEYSEVRPGCDCGCGGDYYDDYPDAWDQMIEANEKTLAEVKELCYNLNIEYDGVGCDDVKRND